MSSSEIADDIAMKLILVLLRVCSHIICINEISRYFINCKGLGEALGSLLILGDAEDADFIRGFWGETAFLFESHSAIIITILRHDCGKIGAWGMIGRLGLVFLMAMLVEGFK
jgi:hypothetical protein